MYKINCIHNFALRYPYFCCEKLAGMPLRFSLLDFEYYQVGFFPHVKFTPPSLHLNCIFFSLHLINHRSASAHLMKPPHISQFVRRARISEAPSKRR